MGLEDSPEERIRFEPGSPVRTGNADVPERMTLRVRKLLIEFHTDPPYRPRVPPLQQPGICDVSVGRSGVRMKLVGLLFIFFNQVKDLNSPNR